MLRPSGKPAADLQTVRLEPISYSDGRHRVATMAESHHPEGWQHAPGSQMGLRSFFRGEKSSTGPTQGSTSIAQVVSPSLPSGDEPTHAPMHIYWGILSSFARDSGEPVARDGPKGVHSANDIGIAGWKKLLPNNQ